MIYNDCKKLLGRVTNLIEKGLVIIGISFFTIVILVNAVEIFSRTVLDFSFYWVQEFTVVLCGYITFLGAAIIFKRKGNILVTFIYNRFPGRMQLVVSFINTLLIVAFLVIGIKASYSYVSFVYGGHTQTMKLPYSLVYLPILISFCLILLVVVEWLLDDVGRLFQK